MALKPLCGENRLLVSVDRADFITMSLMGENGGGGVGWGAGGGGVMPGQQTPRLGNCRPS